MTARGWTDAKKRSIVFTDERFISANNHTTRTMRARTPSRSPRAHNGRQNVAHFQIWAAIGWNWKSKIVFFPKMVDGEKWTPDGEKYKRRRLAPIMKHLRDSQSILQYDGAGPHVAGHVLNSKGVRHIDNWPPYSPDLNPIEELRGLDRKIAEKEPHDSDSLQTA